MGNKKYAEIEHIHWKIFIVIFGFIAFIFFTIISNNYEYDKIIDSLPHWECHNNKISDDWEDCLDKCLDVAYANVSFICNPNIKYDCEGGRIESERAYENYRLCAKAYDCMNIEPEVEEVCEIV